VMRPALRAVSSTPTGPHAIGPDGLWACCLMIFPGSQFELLTGRQVAGLHHGARSDHPRRAVVFSLYADGDAQIKAVRAVSTKRHSLAADLPCTADILRRPLDTAEQLGDCSGKEWRVLCFEACQQAFDATVPLPDLSTLSTQNIRDHWNLLLQLVEGKDGCCSYPSVQEREWWDAKIAAYLAWLTAIQHAVNADGPFESAVAALPSPPREIRYLWVTHML